MIKNILLFLSIFTISRSSLITSTLTHRTCIVFFSGGSNLITPQIYSNFLTRLNQEYDLYTIKSPSKNKLLNKINIKQENNINSINYIKILNTLDGLNKSYNNIYFLGHSSGSTTAINNIDTYVDGIILLDPVKTPYYVKQIDNNLKKVLILNADLSYKWSLIPPFLPFIPTFKISPDNIYNDLNIKLSNIEYFIIKNYGHTDIIDNPWRNIMHYTGISRGNDDRNQDSIDSYHDFLIEIIKNYIRL